MKIIILSLLLVVGPAAVWAGSDHAEDYVAHEWGTFTSVQGADGVLLEWSPLETSELPGFVYGWSKPALNRLRAGALDRGLKSRFITLQRMETPVIYFYSDKERTVDVSVRFPQGLITEWFPQAADIGPSSFPPNKVALGPDDLAQQSGLNTRVTLPSVFGKKGDSDSRIAWRNIHVLPAAQHARIEEAMPKESSGSHYFAARETDAAYLRVTSSGHSAPAIEHEKFLFYRGVASFTTPLQVTFNGGNETNLLLRNTGTGEIRHAFILVVDHGRGRFIYESQLPPGRQVSVALPSGTDLQPLEDVVTRISDRMSGALVAEGLYEREARAMVKTWRKSWFEEDGLRVLYLLPRPWTDEVLPLTLDPEPHELVRTMVGRAEIIAPDREWDLLKQIVQFATGDLASQEQAATKVRRLGFGRFIEPALRRVLGSHPSREFSQAGWELMTAVTGPRNEGKPIARY